MSDQLQLLRVPHSTDAVDEVRFQVDLLRGSIFFLNLQLHLLMPLTFTSDTFLCTVQGYVYKVEPPTLFEV